METDLYTFEDVVEVLNSVTPHDWKGFLTDRLEVREAGTSLDGLERGGYRLVYRDTPSDFAIAEDALNSVVNLRFSLGLTVGTTGAIQEVLWESPAFHAGLTAATEITAVNGRDFTTEELQQAISDAAGGEPLTVLVKQAGETREVVIDYTGGHRYPHLDPIDGARLRLDEIYAPRTGG